MATLLLKTEPDEYSFDDLVRDGTTAWTGITNAAALLAVRSAAKGDQAFVYHTGREKRIVGLAVVTRGPYPDPDANDEKLVAIDIKGIQPVPRAVTLAEIKADARFASFALVRQSRLSAMVVPAQLDAILRQMAGLTGPSAAPAAGGRRPASRAAKPGGDRGGAKDAAKDEGRNRRRPKEQA
ncbi:MAG: EVE domain-containing protein [Planctomycetota bacterium]|nr:EVE domain-containing protein [Planctomycetota bacterium]